MPFALLALLVAAAAAAGSLYLSLEMGLKACALCFYQRAFAFGLVGVLLTGLLAFPDRAARLCLPGCAWSPCRWPSPGSASPGSTSTWG
jgi:disulfide bond formation protein DsbB